MLKKLKNAEANKPTAENEQDNSRENAMVYRRMYAAYAADAKSEYKEIEGNRALTVTLARFRDLLFLYYETDDVTLLPTDVIAGETRPFPDGSAWFFMPDIFHYARPRSLAHWRRTGRKKPLFRINRLDKNQIGSYVFYHQQFQEEYTRKGDMYGMIGLYNGYICFYSEKPEILDPHPLRGRLRTKNTPLRSWRKIMTSHFVPWDDFRGDWRTMNILLYRPWKEEKSK